MDDTRKKVGLLLHPNVEPKSKFPEALVYLLSGIGVMDLSLADYQPEPGVECRAIEIALPDGKTFAIRLVP